MDEPGSQWEPIVDCWKETKEANNELVIPLFGLSEYVASVNHDTHAVRAGPS